MKGTIELRSKLDKNGVGTWRIEISNGKLPDGSYDRIRRSFRGTKEQAELQKAEILIQLSKNEYTHDSNITLKELSTLWLKSITSDVEPNTYKFYDYNLQAYILPEIGTLPIKQIQPITVDVLLNTLKEKPFPKSPNGLSISTIRHVRSTLSACLSYAVSRQMLHTNPCTEIRLRRPSYQIKSTDVFTTEETITFLRHAKEEYYYIYFLLALETGMRQNEILALVWENVDFKNGIIRVDRAIKKNDKDGLVIGDPKTSAGVRSVAVRDKLLIALKRHKAKQNREKLKAGNEYVDQGLVVANLKGKVVNQRHLQRVMRRIIEKAKVPQIPPRNLRHTHATLLLSAGVPPKVIQERLGHSDITITLNIYSAVLPHMQTEAVKKFDQVLTW